MAAKDPNMALAELSEVPQRRSRTRKSIAHMPTHGLSDDKENTAPVVMEAASALAATRSTGRKTRSKSLGPGGLNALEQSNPSKRHTSAIAHLPKSILMPTIPLSPLQEIPTRKQSPTKNYASPTRSSERKSISPNKIVESQSPSKSPTRMLLERAAKQETEEEKQARKMEKERAQKHREARRKSMAARRVSFAPEATLHTWDVIEYQQDSTTSSTSTNSTQQGAGSRASMASNGGENSPSTPPKQSNDSTNVPESPEHQRDVHQAKRRRRSSTIPPMNFNDPDLLSSSEYASDSENGDEDTVLSGKSSSQQGSSPAGSISSGSDGDASMDLTGVTNLEEAQENALKESGNEALDAALEQAATQAGRKPLEYDEDGDVSMEIVGNDITAAFKPWVQKSMGAASPHPNPRRLSSATDQENVRPVAESPTPSNATVEEDMSMDITKAVGGIVKQSDKRTSNGRRQSVRARRASIVPNLEEDDGTMAMDFTTAVGGIQNKQRDDNLSQRDENEDLSMEFTTAFGGVRSGQNKDHPRLSTTQADDLEEDVNDMDLTTAVGGIIKRGQQSLVGNRRTRLSTTASATGSPVAAEGRRTRSSSSGTGLHPSTPERVPETPSKQLTPQPTRPDTPSKTPPSANVSMRSPSPKKLFQSQTEKGRSPLSSTTKLFRNSLNGSNLPNVILAPTDAPAAPPRTSTMGEVEAGAGRLPQMLHRRTSIIEQAEQYSPKPVGSAAVRFADARSIAAEVDREREEDMRRESGQFVLEQEANNEQEEENATVTLREMMQSMTPKKKASKAKPRKSLHVGAAKGILGKRPAELDDSDDERSPFKGREPSPVKKIRLQVPQSLPARKASPRASVKEQHSTPLKDSPTYVPTASTPHSQGRFKNVEADSSAVKPIKTFGENADPTDAAVFEEGEKENVKLQDFLNLTGIRFMDALDTTKRRHTIAPAKQGDNGADQFFAKEANEIFEEAAVAGATTVPLYDLFQHACHETKQYVRGGRKILRQLEDQSSKENPVTFRRYMSAAPEERAKMDAQFKIIKTHARSLSKASWYEWRSKLWEGLRDSLQANTAGLNDDLVIIEETERFVENALPALIQEKDQLSTEHTYLSSRADELKEADPRDLSTARARLRSIDADILEKRKKLEQYQKQVEERTTAVQHISKVKSECQGLIKEAHRKRDECKGWTLSEVRKLHEQVSSLEATTGWSITAATTSRLTMVFQSQLQLFFDTAAFGLGANDKAENAPISLSYVADEAKFPLSTERRFFLQFMQAHLQSLTQAHVEIKSLLQFVSTAWVNALTVVDEVVRLGMLSPAHCDIVGDERMIVKTSILLPETQSKVEIGFQVDVAIRKEHELQVKLDSASARCLYGEAFKEAKIKEYLEGFVRNARSDGEKGAWARAVVELSKRLSARSKRP